MKMRPRLCIVMPCYNEESGIRTTIEKVNEKLAQLEEKGLIAKESCMLFADDGSKDCTWELLSEASAEYPETVKAARLAGNRGKEYAVWAGVMEARFLADVVVVMDADLQFDIEAVDEFLQLHREGYDMIYGVKKNRGSEAFYKTIASRLFYGLMQKLGSPIMKNHTDYCLMTRQVIHALSRYGETNIIFRGLLKQLGFKQTHCYFEVKDREEGESKFSLSKLINLSLDAITSFSVAPLRMIAGFGFVIFAISLIMIAYTCVGFFQGNPPDGYATLTCSLWFLGGIGLSCMAIMGEYMGKLYMEAKKRPRYYISERLGIHHK